MTLVVDTFRKLLPPRTKSSPSGWTSFNAACCHHRGHRQDDRKRAGIRFDSGVIYNCFNCKFTASWQPGRPRSEKFKTLCRWLGASNDEINQMIFEALKTESKDYKFEVSENTVAFEQRPLPEGSLPLKDWIEMIADLPDDLSKKLLDAMTYVIDRGFDPYTNNFYWSPMAGYESRVLIPFFYQGNIVGNTARKVSEGKPKYLSDQPPHFVFNIDEQEQDQKYLMVVEGPFDALSVNGVALLTNDIAEKQSRIINSLGSEVIVVPDQDRAGLVLFDRAAELGWSVAMPNWDDDVKDCAEAVQRYGKLFVVVDAIQTAQRGEIKIKMARKAQENKLKRIEHANDIR